MGIFEELIDRYCLRKLVKDIKMDYLLSEEHIEIKTKKTCHGVALYYNILGRKKHKYDRYLIELTRYSAFKDYIQKSQIEEYIDNLIKEMEK